MDTMRHVLVVGRRRLELVNMIAANPELRMSLITEPSCVDLYPPMDNVEVIDNIQELDAARRAALKIADRDPFDVIVAPGESSIPAAGYLRSYFGIAGIQFPVAQAFCDKSAMKSVLRRAGVPVATSALVGEASRLPAAARRLGLPVVVKPVWFDGSAHVYKVRDENELQRLADPAGPLVSKVPAPYLVEELVEVLEEYHCDGLVQDGKVTFVSVSKYLAPLLNSFASPFGSVTLPDGPEQQQLTALHQDAVSALALQNSVTHLEAFRTKSGWLVGEIACRPGGSGIPENLKRAHGFDTWRHYYATELNIQYNWRPYESRQCFAWVMFPVERGTVLAVPGPDLFSDIDAVDTLQVKIRPGDVIDDLTYPFTMAAAAYCRVSSPSDLSELVTLLSSRFEVQYKR